MIRNNDSLSAGVHYLFGRLADTLMLQMLYLVIHYVVDFMYMKLSWIVELLLFVNLTFKNIVHRKGA